MKMALGKTIDDILKDECIDEMNAIRYKLCNDDDYYMELIDKYVDFAIRLNSLNGEK